MYSALGETQTIPDHLAVVARVRNRSYRLRFLGGRAGAQLDNPETARSLLQALFRSDTSLLPDPEAGTLTVRLLH